MSEELQEKGFFAKYAWIFFLAAVGGYAIYAWMNEPEDPILATLDTPENAFAKYVEISYGFLGGTYNFGHLEKVIPEADMAWFQASYQGIFDRGDFADISSVADPAQVGHAARQIVMRNVILGGPAHPASKILSTVSQTETQRVFVVKVPDEAPSKSYTELKVTVIKDGKYWRVSGFGGGRALINGATAAGDRVWKSGEDDGSQVGGASGGAGAPTNAGGSAAMETGIAEAERLIKAAGAFWEQGNFEGAILSAEQAKVIYEAELGANDPKITQVQGMIDAARAKLNAGQN